MSASDALAAVKTLYDVANKVKDNKNELLRLSRRIEHIVVTLDESRSRDIIRPDEYNDALSAIFDFITRTQRLAQRLLKRNLGDRTWNNGEISSELRRLNDDVQNYLSVHTVRALDLIHSSNVEHQSALANNMEEIMVKVAELDYFLRTRTGDGLGWAPSIESQAQTNIGKSINEAKNVSPLALRASHIKGRSSPPLPPSSFKLPSSAAVHSLSSEPEYNPTDEQQVGVNLEGLIQSGNFTLKVVGLRKLGQLEDFDYNLFSSNSSSESSLSTLDLELKADATLVDIMAAIKDAGFQLPTSLYEEIGLRISVTEGDSVFDATVPGGLKVNRSEPLLWWWNKYTSYHGLTIATTPSQTIAKLQHRPAGVVAGGARFTFHRTLRVPEGGISNLPASLGTFPLLSVDRNSRGIPPAVQERGGFLMPMFRREAIWLQFNHLESAGVKGKKGPAVKISVGGVNALSGVSTHSIDPPKFGAKQDYVVVGQQPWLDGIVSGPGIVRQFVAADLGSGYTVEEQVTGKAEIGGFQFDIFPRRPGVDGKFVSERREVDSISSPAELGIAGDQLFLVRPRISTKIPRPTYSSESRSIIRSGSNEWSLSNYKRRVSSTAIVEASYEVVSTTAAFPGPSGRRRSLFCGDYASKNRSDILGVAAGGQIVQKIYRDADSPRVYDQENGRRFYVHIVTPELWETITGVLPPITPITREMYIRNGVNWYKLFDDYVDSITSVSEALSNVLSVTQLDEQNPASSAQGQLPDLIDPQAPPGCSIHPSARSSCVFRPCSHVACSNCLGSAMLAGSKCPKCRAGIEKFVGMETPIPVISQNTRNADQEGEWRVKEIERLATSAAGSNTVVVIHPLEDRPSPLYSLGRYEDLGDR